MLSGYWQYVCCYGYPRYLGSLVVQLAMCGTVLLAYACRCNMLRLKGDTMPFHAFSVVCTVKSWIVMRAHSVTRARARARRSARFVHGTEVIGSTAVLA